MRQADALGDPGVALGRGRQDVGPGVQETPVVAVLRWRKTQDTGTEMRTEVNGLPSYGAVKM